jgi:hypothetical protein
VSDSTRAVENESVEIIVDDEEDMAICVKEIIACIRYVEISVRSAASSGECIIGNGRESRRTGDIEVEVQWADALGSGAPSKASRRACM